MRAWLVAMGVLSACSAPAPIQLKLPEAATARDMHTLLVSLEVEDGQTLLIIDLDDDREQVGRRIPTIAEWEDTPAVYTVLAYTETLDELDVLAGPVTPPNEGAERVMLPKATHGYRAELSVEPPTEWVEGAALPPRLAALELNRASQPVDCATQFVRSLVAGADSTDVLDVLATSPDTALLIIREAGGVPALAELRESGALAVQTLPPEVARIRTLATDGRWVWATDDDDRLLLLELDGTFVAMSPPGTMDGVVNASDLRVHGWRRSAVHTMVGGSTQTVAWPVVSGAPSSFTDMAVARDDRVAALVSRSVWVLENGAWSNELTPDADYGPVTDVASDEQGYYALTGASLFRRLRSEDRWSVFTDVGTLERFQMAAYGDGRLAVTGHGGFIEIAPNRPPYSGWCNITAGTLREIERLSIDPTRTVLYAIDSLDRDGSEPRALVLRVNLPR